MKNGSLLDIIVPHYREPWSEGKKLFDILALQRDVDFSDFRVILVNDGDHDVYPDIVKQNYPYRIDSITIPHSGVSSARNRGIRHSDAEWVMFCDFDDTFTSIYSLRVFIDALGTKNHDLLWTPFYVELNEQQKRQIRKKFNWIFIHGKIFRRSFLLKHRILFEEGLYYSEDTAFCRVIEMEIEPERIGEIRSEITPYVWAYRRGSITTDPGNTFSNAVGLFRRQRYVTMQHLKRGQNDLAGAVALRGLCDAYVTLNRNDLPDIDKSTFRKEVLDFYAEDNSILVINADIVKTALEASMTESGVGQTNLPQDLNLLQWIQQLDDEIQKKGSEENERTEKRQSDQHQGLADQHMEPI